MIRGPAILHDIKYTAEVSHQIGKDNAISHRTGQTLTPVATVDWLVQGRRVVKAESELTDIFLAGIAGASYCAGLVTGSITKVQK